MKLIKFKISQLKDIKNRPTTYLDELKSVAYSVSDTEMTFDLDSENYKALKDKYKKESKPLTQAGNIIKSAFVGVSSIAKTKLGIDVASSKVFAERMAVCMRCPGNHAVWQNVKLKQKSQPKNDAERDFLEKNGYTIYTCGPMLDSMKKSGQSPCGCILNKKAMDVKQDCPFGYWPTVKTTDR